jgi:hypothetical protein
MDETLRIGRSLGVTSLISHHKVIGLANHGRSEQTLPYLAERMREQAVCLDCYPYAASSTVLSEHRAAIAARVKITWSKPHPEHNGRDLAEVAAEMGLTRVEAIERLLPAGGIYFSMAEADVQRILAFPDTMIGSDGIPHDAIPHPRLWGTFPRVLGHYSRDLKLFPLEAAVRKMTGLTARNFNLVDRGELRVGAFADITIFDAAAVADAADFDHPSLPARGIASVIVNGEPVWNDGAPTGARPGQVLSRPRAGSPRLVGSNRRFVRRIGATQRRASFDALEDESLHLLLRRGLGCHFRRKLAGDHHDPLVVAYDHVAGVDGDPAAADRHVQVHCMVVDQVERRTAARAVDREIQGGDGTAVSYRAVGDETCDAPHLQPGRQDLAS